MTYLFSFSEQECLKLGQSVCLVYSEAMKEHLNYADATHPECPDRISCIFEQLCNFGIVERCHRLKVIRIALVYVQMCLFSHINHCVCLLKFFFVVEG